MRFGVPLQLSPQISSEYAIFHSLTTQHELLQTSETYTKVWSDMGTVRHYVQKGFLVCQHQKEEASYSRHFLGHPANRYVTCVQRPLSDHRTGTPHVYRTIGREGLKLTPKARQLPRPLPAISRASAKLVCRHCHLSIHRWTPCDHSSPITQTARTRSSKYARRTACVWR